jgi:ketosteroid isomerase-like protein
VRAKVGPPEDCGTVGQIISTDRPTKGETMIGALLAKRALNRAFAALNRRDLAAFMAAWREDGVFVYPGDLPASGTFEGRDEVEGWFRRFLDQFPRIRFDIRGVCIANVLDLVGTNHAAVHWEVELTNREGREGRNSGVTVIDIRSGKAVRAQDFIFDLGEEFRRNWSAS